MEGMAENMYAWQLFGIPSLIFLYLQIHNSLIPNVTSHFCPRKENYRSEPSIVPLIFELKQNENKRVGWRNLLKLFNFVVWYPVKRDYPRIFFIN